MSYSRSAIVSQAQAWIGCKESDGSHKQIIDIYNAHTPLARGYKMQYTDSWCACYVSAVSIKCGYTAIIPTECSCIQMINLLKNLGEWVEDDSYVPSPGDLILYDWQDTTGSTSDNTGTPDHIGIVEKVENGKITVIEGNMSNAVGRRTLSVNGKYIRGFGAPKYDEDGTSTSTGSGTSTSSGTNTSTSLAAGDKVTLSKVNLYASASAAAAANLISGDYYIWNTTVTNGRIRITNAKANVGISGKITGWVNVSDIPGATASSGATSSGTSASTSASTTTTTKKTTESAKSFDKSLAKTYKVTAKAGLRLRDGAGTDKAVMVTMPLNTQCTCYGYYTTVGGVKWLCVVATVNKVEYTGFCSSEYLA